MGRIVCAHNVYPEYCGECMALDDEEGGIPMSTGRKFDIGVFVAISLTAMGIGMCQPWSVGGIVRGSIMILAVNAWVWVWRIERKKR